jgi:hypothetical protein
MDNGYFMMDFFTGIRLHDITKAPESYEQTLNGFLGIFTSQFVGCMYKFISHYIFKREQLCANYTKQTKKSFDVILEAPDIEYYIRLARHDIDKAFGGSSAGGHERGTGSHTAENDIRILSTNRNRNYAYIRLFAKTIYQGTINKSQSCLILSCPHLSILFIEYCYQSTKSGGKNSCSN